VEKVVKVTFEGEVVSQNGKQNIVNTNGSGLSSDLILEIDRLLMKSGHYMLVEGDKVKLSVEVESATK
jgi:hypothetical protein